MKRFVKLITRVARFTLGLGLQELLKYVVSILPRRINLVHGHGVNGGTDAGVGEDGALRLSQGPVREGHHGAIVVGNLVKGN